VIPIGNNVAGIMMHLNYGKTKWILAVFESLIDVVSIHKIICHVD
jgi:hypothetical protein